MKSALWLGVLGCFVLFLGSSTYGGVTAVAAPSTQTVPLNGTYATLNGSGSYATNPPVPITQWSWDFESDGTYDYTETTLGGGDGIAYKVYDKGGIFTVTLKATDSISRYDTDTQEVKVRLAVSSGELTGKSVQLLWENANNSAQFTRYEVHKSTTQGFTPDANSLVTNITTMATTSYTVTGLTPKTTYYLQVVLVVSGGSIQSNELQRATGG